jgi:hypothetical protein
MGFAVRAFDEVPGEGRRPVVGLRVVSRQVTAADLIGQWVDLTLADWPERAAVDTAVKFAHPDEVALHADRRRRRRLAPPPPAPEVARARALAAFRRGQIVLLVDDRQIEDEEARIGLTDDSEVTFLRLVPLVGG